VIHDARDPANTITMPTSDAATIQPVVPKRRPPAYSANGDRLASTTPSLRLHGPRMPPRRSAAASCASLHIGLPLMTCLSASMPQNSGLVPKPTSTSASSVQMPTITASPPNVMRRPRSSATAPATSHRNGR
jgi:hypothetical protein